MIGEGCLWIIVVMLLFWWIVIGALMSALGSWGVSPVLIGVIILAATLLYIYNKAARK